MVSSMVRRRAWGGPGKGTRAIRGEDWLPYQPPSVVTPPFAEYVSGHSIFSAAAAEVLASFSGSRRYGGIPFEAGDLDGRRLGRRIGANAWAKASGYFDGMAAP